MKILVTGSEGFIGKNLLAELKNRGYEDVLVYDKQSTPEHLELALQLCDVIVHLAGVNRPVNEAEFETVNAGLTEYIVGYLNEIQRTPRIIFSSSMQAQKENLYGKSKKRGEEVLCRYAEETGAQVLIFRFPNVFGKWCRPNYNSVVATFCHNISRDMEICIHDETAKLQLVYIDDVVTAIIDAFDCEIGQCAVKRDVTPIYETTVGELATILKRFWQQRNTKQLPDVSDMLEKKLYSTFLSYLPETAFGYPLKMNVDERGSFTEILKGDTFGQVSVNVAKPGITKGNHWHRTKVEKFLVVKGMAKIRFRHMVTNESVEYNVTGDQLIVIDIPAGYTHSIENVGTEDLVTIMWANECFEAERPDTYFEKV